MKRTHRGTKEFTEIQKLKEENKSLKRQIAQLRKLVSRLDVDRLDTVKDILLEEEVSKKTIEKIEEKWRCFECNKGKLEMHTINRLDGLHYYRKCNLCNNRTRLKKWTPDVKE